MASSFSLGKVELAASLDAAEVPDGPDPETPFRIAILGDFSGRASRGAVEAGAGLVGRRLHAIDRDDLDLVMGRLKVELHLPLAGEGGAPLVLRFRELDDFHPDQIAAQAEVFGALRERRRSPGRSPAPPPAAGATRGSSEPIGDVTALVPDNLLEQILAAKRSDAPPPAREDDPWASSWTGSSPRTGSPPRIRGRPSRRPASTPRWAG